MGTSKFLNFLIRLEVKIFTRNDLIKNILTKIFKSRMAEGKGIWKCGNKLNLQDIFKTIG